MNMKLLLAITFTSLVLHQVKTLPTDVINEEQTELQTKEVILTQIFEEIENYTSHVNVIKLDIDRIRHSLNKAKRDLEKGVRTFLDKKILSDNDIYIKYIIPPVESSECRDYGRNCLQIKRERCEEHLLDRTTFTENVNEFSKVLLIDYTDQDQSFGQNLERILLEIRLAKMLTFAKYNQVRMNNSNIQEAMKEWKIEMFNNLTSHENTVMKMLPNFISTFQTLSQRVNHFENSLLKFINKQKIDRACCLQDFGFPVDFWCNSSELLEVVPERPPFDVDSLDFSLLSKI